MGWLDRFRRRVDGFRPHQPDVGPTLDDVERVRHALLAEADRLGRREGLSLTLLLEYSDLDFSRIDIYAVLPHLAAEGEIANVQADSFGNQRFDLTDKLGATDTSLDR